MSGIYLGCWKVSLVDKGGATVSLCPLPPRWLLLPCPLGTGVMNTHLTLRWEQTCTHPQGYVACLTLQSLCPRTATFLEDPPYFPDLSKNCVAKFFSCLWIPFHGLNRFTQLVVFIVDLLLWGYFKVMNRVVPCCRHCYMGIWGDHGSGEGWQVSKSTETAQCRKG